MDRRHARRPIARAALALAAVLLTLAAAPAHALAAPPAHAATAAPAHAHAPAAPPLAASVDDFTFDSLDVDYTLIRSDDGTSRMSVVETFVAVFPETDQNRGIRRSIPASYNGQPLHPHLVSLTDENGASRNADTETEDDVFSIVSRADDYVHGRQTYVITYTLENVVWEFADTGLEFYWDVDGVGWAQPFGTVTARLHLDPDLAGQLSGRMSCYQGYHGGTDACVALDRRTEPDGGALITARADDLAAHQTLTLAVGFRDGTFEMFDASYLAAPAGWLQGIAGLGAIGAFVLAIRARRRGLADEPGRPTIIAEYTPPDAVDALESAVLLGRPTKGIPAEVLEQAVVGSIRITEGERRWGGKAKLVAELVDPSLADGDGRMLLDGLFPNGRIGDTYEFGRQDTRFSSVAQSILAEADRDLTARGMRRTVPAGTRAWPVVASVVALALIVGFGVWALIWGTDPLVPVLVIVGGAIVFVVVMFAVARTPLSALGAETRDHLRGLEEFIGWAEADRIRMLQSPQGAERVRIDARDPRQKLDLYERLLPYAVVFGQEKQWSKQLAVLYDEVGVVAPVWYSGSGAFDASSFSAGIGTLSAEAVSSSSTSGGSSGGGSAGGGGGGGGGGGV